jgi:hypothetical protein
VVRHADGVVALAFDREARTLAEVDTAVAALAGRDMLADVA